MGGTDYVVPMEMAVTSLRSMMGKLVHLLLPHHLLVHLPLLLLLLYLLQLLGHLTLPTLLLRLTLHMSHLQCTQRQLQILYPLHIPPTSYPTEATCGVKGDPCTKHNQCCGGKCNLKKICVGSKSRASKKSEEYSFYEYGFNEFFCEWFQ